MAGKLIRKIEFKEISSNEFIPDIWKKIIPKNTNGYIKQYSQGEKIGFHSGRKIIYEGIELCNPLGIILSGKAEICEIHKTASYYPEHIVYRPIRILKSGDMFGGFSIIDSCFGETNNYQDECWEFYAGAVSVMLKLTKKITNSFIPDKFMIEKKMSNEKEGEVEYKSCNPHHILNDILKSNNTEIVFLDSGFITRDNEAFNELIAYSWLGAKTYRDSLNSFNYGALLKFRMDKYNKLTKGLKLDNKIKLLNLFFDVIYDTCNRPVRNEPMFIPISVEYPDIGINIENLIKKEYKISLNEVLVASQKLDDFWFPVDYNHYLIASHDTNSLNLTSLLTPEQMSAYQKLIIRLLEKFTASRDDYPFEITCKDVLALGKKKNIALFFKKK